MGTGRGEVGGRSRNHAPLGGTPRRGLPQQEPGQVRVRPRLLPDAFRGQDHEAADGVGRTMPKACLRHDGFQIGHGQAANGVLQPSSSF